MEPLSQKTIEEKYKDLGLSTKKVELVHEYFQCLSNLYGVIDYMSIYEIIKGYGDKVTKRELFQIMNIASREDNKYSIIFEDDLYIDGNANVMYLTNNELVAEGYDKYCVVCRVFEAAATRPRYIPKTKEELFKNKEDQFYLTTVGSTFANFVKNMKTNGNTEITKGHKGERLCDFSCLSYNENLMLSRKKDKAVIERYIKKHTGIASDKFLGKIKYYISMLDDGTNMISFISKLLTEYDVALSTKEYEKYLKYVQELNNKSTLWVLNGNTPDSLPHSMPDVLRLGPNLRNEMESEEFDIEGFRKFLESKGIKLE